MKNKKGFTLIELLAVIVILGLLMAIAIPSVTKYIQQSKKKTLIDTIQSYTTAVINAVNDMTYGTLSNGDNLYYIPIECVSLEKGGTDPFGEWEEAYVVVHYNADEYTYDYYFTYYDSAGYGMELTKIDEISQNDIKNPTEVNASTVASQTINDEKIQLLKSNSCNSSDVEYRVSKKIASKCYSYRLKDNNTATITYYDSSCGKDVVIPDKIDNYTVTEIYAYAFYNMSLTSVVIPNSVTSIGSRAFGYNKLKSVTLPTSLVTIDSEAFMKNQIPSIDFSNTKELKTIGVRSFRYNNISSIDIPNNVTTIGACAFCDNKINNPSFLYYSSNGVVDYSRVRGYIGDLSEFSNKKFVIPSEVNGVKLKRIESSAFYNMSLSGWEVVIPDTVTYIGSSAFAASGINKVNLPSGLVTIGSSAFYNNKISNIDIPSSVTSIGELAFNLNSTTDPDEMWIYKRTAKGIDYSTLIGYSGANKANISIPSVKNGVQLKTIASSCFRYLSLTGGIKIPSTVTSVGQLAFALNKLSYVDNGDGDTTGPFVYSRNSDGSINKSSLLSYASYQTANVIIPSNVKRIENYAFYYTYIKGVTIPEGVTYIGSYAFDLCKLSSVSIPSTVTTIGTNAFRKQMTWTSNNGSLTKIVNKTGKSFDWKNITSGPSDATFVTGTVENWYGNIEVIDN